MIYRNTENFIAIFERQNPVETLVNWPVSVVYVNFFFVDFDY
jgi:hypothetical protein